MSPAKEVWVRANSEKRLAWARCVYSVTQGFKEGLVAGRRNCNERRLKTETSKGKGSPEVCRGSEGRDNAVGKAGKTGRRISRADSTVEEEGGLEERRSGF